MKIYEIVAQLRSETSSKESLKIVVDNPKCHETLKYLCNPYIRTGMSKLPKSVYRPRGSEDPDMLTKALIDYFSDCGPNGPRHLKEESALYIYLKGPSDEDWEWFVELISTHGGSSAFGVGPNTLKKAGIEVPTFGCQLGVKLADIGNDTWLETDGREVQRWRISEKIDGTRRLFIKKGGEVEAYSRSGRIDDTLTHITEYIASDKFPDNRIYDCELVDGSMYDNWKEGDQSFELRAKSIGKASRKSGDKSSLIAICFDYYDFDSPDMTTGQRTKELIRLFDREKPVGPVRLVEIFGKMNGYEKERVDGILKRVLDRGGEGLMLQELRSKYIFERTPNLIKVKRLEDYTGTITRVMPGRKGTRLENLMSSIECRIEGCDNLVCVGTGLSDYDRKLFTEHAQELIGSKVEVEAFSKTVNKDGKTSLCFPVYKRCLNKIFNEVE